MHQEARTGAGAHRHAARQAQRTGRLRRGADHRAAASTAGWPRQSPEEFIQQVLIDGLGARYVLVGDDFRFGAKRAGDYAMLDAAGDAARLRRGAHEQLRGARPAGVELRRARSAGRRPHGRRPGPARAGPTPSPATWSTAASWAARWAPRRRARTTAFAPSTCASSTGSRPPAASSRCWCTGWPTQPLPGVANLGVRPSLDANDVNAGRVLLETHCLDWPAATGRRGGLR